VHDYCGPYFSSSGPEKKPGASSNVTGHGLYRLAACYCTTLSKVFELLRAFLNSSDGIGEFPGPCDIYQLPSHDVTTGTRKRRGRESRS